MPKESFHPDSKLDQERKTQMVKRSNIFILLAVIFLILGVGGLCAVCSMYYMTRMAETQHGIVFDAGSSHTSMYLYEWPSEKTNGTGEVKQTLSCDVDGGGLSDYIDNPSQAGSSLTACLDVAAGNLSWASKPYTPVYLGATAGMRIERLENAEQSAKVFDSVREEVSNSGFQVTDIKEQVKILPGRDEGVGLWVTANYVAGTLGIIMYPKFIPLLPKGVSATLGVLDLGGASTQVSFALHGNVTAPTSDVEKLTIFSRELTVYADSFLCFGAKEMRNQVLAIVAKKANYEGQVVHPCYATGYEKNMTYADVFDSACTDSYANNTKKGSTMTIVGAGNNTECDKLMVDLFEDSPFFDGSVTPLPDRIVARGAFYYTISDLNAVNKSHQVDYDIFVNKMTEWCRKPYDEIKTKDFYDPAAVCVNGHYIHHLLANVYKIPADKWNGILFANKIGTVSMGWTLGYMTNITSAIPHAQLKLYNISTAVFIAVVVISVVLLVLGLIAIFCACRFRRAQYVSLSHQLTEPF